MCVAEDSGHSRGASGRRWTRKGEGRAFKAQTGQAEAVGLQAVGALPGGRSRKEERRERKDDLFPWTACFSLPCACISSKICQSE